MQKSAVPQVNKSKVSQASAAGKLFFQILLFIILKSTSESLLGIHGLVPECSHDRNCYPKYSDSGKGLESPWVSLNNPMEAVLGRHWRPEQEGRCGEELGENPAWAEIAQQPQMLHRKSRKYTNSSTAAINCDHSYNSCQVFVKEKLLPSVATVCTPMPRRNWVSKGLWVGTSLPDSGPKCSGAAQWQPGGVTFWTSDLLTALACQSTKMSLQSWPSQKMSQEGQKEWKMYPY